MLRHALDRWAAEKPESIYAVFDDGSAWTFEQTRHRARSSAAALSALGVERGDHVAVWLPSGMDVLQAMLGINYLGAVYVPFNTAYRGSLLAHVIDNADADVLLTATAFLSRLREVSTGSLRTLVVVDASEDVSDARVGALHVCGRDAFQSTAEPPVIAHPIEPWETQSIIYTSGTTGPSKGVLSSYLHAYANMGPQAWPCISASDRYLLTLPMFHIGGSFIANIMLCLGGSVAMAGEFSTARFWQTVERTESTVVFLLGAMATFLSKADSASSDRSHGLRTVMVVPLPADVAEFAERFDVTVYTIFNMTEISTPTFSGPNPSVAGTCGTQRDGVEVRLVDNNDCEVPLGEVGEMILRTDVPWCMNHGYYKDPQATARAWRNGWFHTGDAFKQDAAGNYYFVDRMKDTIRRRGENISSFEVEMDALAHPCVREAAAVPVPSEFGEDEVLLIVSPRLGATIDERGLFDFLVPRMAHFMLPRYIRVIDDLPKTPTAKVRKHALRNEGVPAACWDREAVGIRVKRDGVYMAAARD